VISSTTEPGEAKPGEQDPEESPPPAMLGDAKDTAKKEEKPSTIKRPITPPASADPTELDIRPDADGRVCFNFRGRTWPALAALVQIGIGLMADW
jgi:hypothetical protein